MRSSSSPKPAAAPHWAWVGNRAISRLEPPIKTMLRLSMLRRPSRSPMGPSTKLPTGRIK